MLLYLPLYHSPHLVNQKQLDSTSAREVMSAIRTLAVAEGMIVLATIHQPSLETLAQFTNILLLAEGKTCFSGKVSELERFFESWGRPVERFVSRSIICRLAGTDEELSEYTRRACDELPQR